MAKHLNDLGYSTINEAGAPIFNYHKDNALIQIDVKAKAVRKVNQANRSAMFLTEDEIVAVYNMNQQGYKQNYKKEN